MKLETRTPVFQARLHNTPRLAVGLHGAATAPGQGQDAAGVSEGNLRGLITDRVPDSGGGTFICLHLPDGETEAQGGEHLAPASHWDSNPDPPDPTALTTPSQNTHIQPPTGELLFAILFPVNFWGPWLSPASLFPGLRILTVQ